MKIVAGHVQKMQENDSNGERVGDLSWQTLPFSWIILGKKGTLMALTIESTSWE